jgi:hypothetical protein
VQTGDTRLTNRGDDHGRATPRHSVFQAGTAVHDDDRGIPGIPSREVRPADVEAGRSPMNSRRDLARDGDRCRTAQPSTPVRRGNSPPAS